MAKMYAILNYYLFKFIDPFYANFYFNLKGELTFQCFLNWLV